MRQVPASIKIGFVVAGLMAGVLPPSTVALALGSNIATPASIPSPTRASELPPPPRFPLPALRLAPSDRRLTVRLVNFSNARVRYEAIGQTNHQRLEGLLDRPSNAAVTLDNLPLPLNLTINREDGAHLLVRPFAGPGGRLDLILEAVERPELDCRFVNVLDNGQVYLY